MLFLNLAANGKRYIFRAAKELKTFQPLKTWWKAENQLFENPRRLKYDRMLQPGTICSSINPIVGF